METGTSVTKDSSEVTGFEAIQKAAKELVAKDGIPYYEALERASAAASPEDLQEAIQQG